MSLLQICISTRKVSCYRGTYEFVSDMDIHKKGKSSKLQSLVLAGYINNFYKFLICKDQLLIINFIPNEYLPKKTHTMTLWIIICLSMLSYTTSLTCTALYLYNLIYVNFNQHAHLFLLQCLLIYSLYCITRNKTPSRVHSFESHCFAARKNMLLLWPQGIN